MSIDGPKEKKIKLPGWMVAGGLIVAKVSATPITQFIAIISTNQKKRVANLLEPLSFLKMGKELIKKEGIGVLVKGSMTSATREGVKAAGKVHFQKISEHYAKNAIDAFFPNWTGTSRDIVQGGMTGIPAGAADALVASPIERVKIYIMTSGKKMGFWSAVSEIYGEHKHKPGIGRITDFANELVFKGIGPSIVKQSAILSTLTIVRPKTNQALSPYKKDNPKATAFFSALITGGFAAVVAAVPDLYKIKKQSKISVDSESFFVFAKKVYKINGTKALSGVPGTFFLSVLGQGLTAGALNVYDEYVGVDDENDSAPPHAGRTANTEPSKYFEGNEPPHSCMVVDDLMWGFNNMTLSEYTPPKELEKSSLENKFSKMTLKE